MNVPLPPPDHAFFITPRNRDFLIDKTPLISVPSPLDEGKGVIGFSALYILLIVGTLIVVAWVGKGSEYAFLWNCGWVFSAMALLVLMTMIHIYRHNQRITRRLAESGQIITGVIHHARGEVRKSGSRGSKQFHLIVEYAFTLPDGSSKIGTREQVRSDLQGHPLPAPDTPVYILYFTPDEFYLL